MLNYNNQLSCLDTMNIMSFVIGLMNYNENLTQNDKQELLSEFNNKAEILLNEIHSHLEQQDKKLDAILARLEELSNDS